ncbi:helix-turn-helix transcriptional regulator [Oleiharenicola lentus]|uniref:helix-turn-helix transcriptional regulator n=1 Tax=Oleiharenicola lentus TaxID=2508720 RepID=UPI003F67BF47
MTPKTTVTSAPAIAGPVSPIGIHLNDWMDALLGRVNEALTLDAFWKAVVQLFQQTMPVQSCSMMYAILDANTLTARHHVCYDLPSRMQLASNLTIASNYLSRHPQIKMYTFSQILNEDPTAQDRANEQQKALPESWIEFVHLAFWDRNQLDAVFSIRRGPTQGRFSPAELELLSRFHSVISAGLHRIRLLGVQQEQRGALERFFSRCPIPVLFLDSRLRLLYATQEALEMSLVWNYGHEGARRQHPRKSFLLPPDIAAVCQSLIAAGPTDGVRRGSEDVRVTHPKEVAMVARVRIEYPSRPGWLQPTISITFCTEHNLDGARLPAKKISLDLLQRLSANERRVALLVCQGFSNSVIATKLGKSARTVECQLTVIFRKLQVTNRVQLAHLLS